MASFSAFIVPLTALNEVDERNVRNWLGDQLDNPSGSKGEPSGAEMKDNEDMAALLIHLHADKTAPTCEANRFVLMLVLLERWPVGSNAQLRGIAAGVGALPSAIMSLCARLNLC